MIPANELGRRICVASHPHLNTTGATVPCGTHLQSARNVFGLLAHAGDVVLLEVMRARLDAGVFFDRGALYGLLGPDAASGGVVDAKGLAEDILSVIHKHEGHPGEMVGIEDPADGTMTTITA